jgi:hypothetical protein
MKLAPGIRRSEADRRDVTKLTEQNCTASPSAITKRSFSEVNKLLATDGGWSVGVGHKFLTLVLEFLNYRKEKTSTNETDQQKSLQDHACSNGFIGCVIDEYETPRNSIIPVSVNHQWFTDF